MLGSHCITGQFYFMMRYEWDAQAGLELTGYPREPLHFPFKFQRSCDHRAVPPGPALSVILIMAMLRETGMYVSLTLGSVFSCAYDIYHHLWKNLLRALPICD